MSGWNLSKYYCQRRHKGTVEHIPIEAPSAEYVLTMLKVIKNGEWDLEARK